MRFLKSPLGATLLFGLVIVVFQFTDKAEATREIGILVLLALVTLFIHELGHVLFGVMAGYQFQFLTAGPITVERWKIRTNESWMYFGGVASCLPQTDDLQKIRRQHVLFAAGGPILSALVGGIALAVSYGYDWAYMQFFGILNMGIFLVTSIPFKGALKSDGRVLLELLVNGGKASSFLSEILLVKEMMTPKSPIMWPRHLVEEARNAPKTEETMMSGYLVFFYDFMQHGFEQATRGMDPYKTLEVTSKNKIMLQFATHLKQLDLVQSGEATAESLRALHAQMLPMEPVSYKRSEWLIYLLAGEEALASEKLAEHRKQLAEGKRQYGFFVAEERLTEMLVEKLIKISS